MQDVPCFLIFCALLVSCGCSHKTLPLAKLKPASETMKYARPLKRGEPLNINLNGLDPSYVERFQVDPSLHLPALDPDPGPVIDVGLNCLSHKTLVYDRLVRREEVFFATAEFREDVKDQIAVTQESTEAFAVQYARAGQVYWVERWQKAAAASEGWESSTVSGQADPSPDYKCESSVPPDAAVVYENGFVTLVSGARLSATRATTAFVGTIRCARPNGVTVRRENAHFVTIEIRSPEVAPLHRPCAADGVVLLHGEVSGPDGMRWRLLHFEIGSYKSQDIDSVAGDR